ncbi:MAG: hypothetical protein ACOY4Q_14430, partial [Bacillota bacterium]
MVQPLKGKAKILIPFLSLLFTLAIISAVAAADSLPVPAGGPEITFVGAGREFDTHRPALAVNLKSDVKINSQGSAMWVDGRQVNPVFSYRGHMQPIPYSEYEQFVVDSYLDATLTYAPESLTDGIHTLKVTAADEAGKTSTQEWTFSVAQKPLLSGLEPKNGSTVNTKGPAIKAVITNSNGPAIDKTSIRLTLDGRQVIPVLAETGGTVNLTYTADKLNDDSFHDLFLEAADTAGNRASAGWQFYINSKGEMTTDARACGSCHGLNLFSKYVHQKGPDEGLKGSGGACGHCHRSYEPQFCGYCHNGDPWAIRMGQAAPDPGFQADKDCTFCHARTPAIYSGMQSQTIVRRQINTGVLPANLSSWNILTHDILPLHNIAKGNCNNCHSVFLTREHNRVTKEGVRLDCATCHNSIDPLVQQAVANKNKDCSACHVRADHEYVHTGGLDSNCLICHRNVLTQEHLANTTTTSKNYTCDTCHASSIKEVSRAVRSDNLNCAGCHKAGHNLNIADKVPADIPLYSLFSWSLPMEASV